MNPTLESVRVSDSQEGLPTYGAALFFSELRRLMESPNLRISARFQLPIIRCSKVLCRASMARPIEELRGCRRNLAAHGVGTSEAALRKESSSGNAGAKFRALAQDFGHIRRGGGLRHRCPYQVPFAGGAGAVMPGHDSPVVLGHCPMRACGATGCAVRPAGAAHPPERQFGWIL